MISSVDYRRVSFHGQVPLICTLILNSFSIVRGSAPFVLGTSSSVIFSGSDTVSLAQKSGPVLDRPSPATLPESLYELEC